MDNQDFWDNFEKDLESLIGSHSVDTMVGCPDYILAETLVAILKVQAKASLIQQSLIEEVKNVD